MRLRSRGPFRSRVAGLLTRSLGWLLASAGIASALAAMGGALGWWGLATPVMVVAGVFLIDVGRKLATSDGAELLKRDTRAPVVYFRSFKGDGHTEELAPVSFMMSRDQTDESALAEALLHVGPMVAIGEPKDRLAKLGAARMYVGDDWREVADDLMDRAELVVMFAGGTDGFWWEVERVALDGTRVDSGVSPL